MMCKEYECKQEAVKKMEYCHKHQLELWKERKFQDGRVKQGLRASGKYDATVEKAKRMIQETQGEPWAKEFV